jgi:hypothetical protein
MLAATPEVTAQPNYVCASRKGELRNRLGVTVQPWWRHCKLVANALGAIALSFTAIAVSDWRSPTRRAGGRKPFSKVLGGPSPL